MLPTVTSLKGEAAHEPAPYNAGFINPAAEPRLSSMTAVMAAHRGAAALVPPITCQLLRKKMA